MRIQSNKQWSTHVAVYVAFYLLLLLASPARSKGQLPPCHFFIRPFLGVVRAGSLSIPSLFIPFLRLASILIICLKDAGELFKNPSPRLKKVLTVTIFRTWPAAWEVGNNWPNGVSSLST